MDSHRPAFHFVAPTGWMNDPNGVGQWNGTYHLFYQYSPDSPANDAKEWGHATSTDLVHWSDEPVALSPTPGGPDADGCWSGVLLNDNGVPTLVYSGNRDDQQRPCIATGDADLRHWQKYDGNPVIAEPPAELDLVAYRDHSVWREGEVWSQLVGAGIRGEGGTALRYTSTDLRHWTYEGPILVGDASATEPVYTGTMWECVDFVRLADKHVLILSAWDEGSTNHSAYYTGTYADGRFTPEHLGLLDYGLNFFYAPQSFRDESGRQVMYGWLQEGRPDAVRAHGWSGAMSLPRRLELAADGSLLQVPVDEVAALRGSHAGVPAADLQPGQAIDLDQVHGDQLDLEATLVLSAEACVELAIRSTPDGAEQTVVVLDRAAGELRLDRKNSSLGADLDTRDLRGPLPIGPDGVVELRVIVDHSALEIFANGRALTARVYPTREDATGVRIAASNAPASLTRLDAWTMTGIWDGPRQARPDPATSSK
ncbi:glycoside hydrolase family 32 protein [Flindersiella endophytica]